MPPSGREDVLIEPWDVSSWHFSDLTASSNVRFRASSGPSITSHYANYRGLFLEAAIPNADALEAFEQEFDTVPLES